MILAYLCLLVACAVFFFAPPAWTLLALVPCAFGMWVLTGGFERHLRRRGWHT